MSGGHSLRVDLSVLPSGDCSCCRKLTCSVWRMRWSSRLPTVRFGFPDLLPSVCYIGVCGSASAPCDRAKATASAAPRALPDV